MAEIAPFRGLRYNPDKAPDLSKVTAPPYDVIDEAGRAELARRDEHNIVRLILPEEEGGRDRYACAADLLERWLDEDVLVQDAEPGIYVIRQEWQDDAGRHERTGFVAAVKLEPFSQGKIYPHESTMSSPKEDRLKLLKATRTNLSQVFSLFPDERQDVDAWLTATSAGTPDAQSIDDAGVLTKLWCVFDETSIRALRDMLKGREMFIADGHHRYETALNYQRFCAESVPEFPREPSESSRNADQIFPHDALMMLCVATNNAGVLTRPTHRLLSRDAADPENLIQRLKERFSVRSIATFSHKTGELDAILRSDATPNLMVLYVGASRPPMTVQPQEGEKMLAHMPEHSEIWRSLDVSILQYAILEGILGLSLEHVTQGNKIGYVHDADEAKRRVDAGEFSAAFVLRPTPLRAMVEVASHLERMPPKSTFFYPKAVTGMVLRRLESGKKRA